MGAEIIGQSISCYLNAGFGSFEEREFVVCVGQSNCGGSQFGFGSLQLITELARDGDISSVFVTVKHYSCSQRESNQHAIVKFRIVMVTSAVMACFQCFQRSIPSGREPR